MPLLQKGDDGAFLLTKTFESLGSGKYKLNIGCSHGSAAKDLATLDAAQKEFQYSARVYAGKVNDAVKPISKRNSSFAKNPKAAIQGASRIPEARSRKPRTIAPATNTTSRKWMCGFPKEQAVKEAPTIPSTATKVDIAAIERATNVFKLTPAQSSALYDARAVGEGELTAARYAKQTQILADAGVPPEMRETALK